MNESPVYNVRRVPVEKIRSNVYNPNKVAPPEMKLLYKSICEDGYTMPIVCYYLSQEDKYEIVDGFHRYMIMINHRDIYNRENGCLPVVVIDKDESSRIASTVRHNMARGTHQVELSAKLIGMLKKHNWTDARIGLELGMDADEVLRLKQVTGLMELFKDREFSSSWE